MYKLSRVSLAIHMEEGERKERKPAPKGTFNPELATPAIQEHPQAAQSEGHDGDETDVCSEKFNPLLALYSPTVQLPFPNVKRFNNVAEYESFLKGGRGRAKPENVEKRRRKAMKGVADPERIERLKKLMVNNPVSEPQDQGESSGTKQRRKSKPVKNVLTRMPLCQGSPLGELYRCVQERIRVRVHIRTFKGLRGVCSGFIVAFDRFWNLAMVDVDETYREPLLGQALYHDKALTITRLFEKLKLQQDCEAQEAAKTVNIQSKESEPDSSASRGSETMGGKEVSQKKVPQKYGKVHTRHINQLFIRGENVILVCPQPL